MKNNDLIAIKLEEALSYLYKQEEKLKPVMDLFVEIIKNNIKKEDISVKDAIDMLNSTQEQYTNTILLITKIKEIIEFNN